MRKFIPWILFSAAAGCAPEVIRVPSICTNAPYCVSPDEFGDPIASADRTRLQAFLKRNAESTVFVRSATYRDKDGVRYRRATGAIIGVKGLVLTEYASISGSEYITVSYRRMADDGTITLWREVPAEIVAIDRERDVALLRIKQQDLMPAPFPLRRGPSVKGDRDWYFGSETAWRRTRITDINVSRGSFVHGFMTTDAKIMAADVGAPIVNDCGELVGIIMFDDGKGAVFAYPIDGLFEALDIKMQDLY